MKLISLSIGALVLVAACASPKAPTLTRQDKDDADARYEVLNALPATAAMPTMGTANYTGKFGGSLSGDSDGELLGDISMEADFASSVLSGSVTNLNTYNDAGEPDQLLSGGLNVNGNFVGNAVTASATGTLTGVDSGFSGDTNVDIAMNGTFRDNTGTADVITGTAIGCGTGDFDICLDGGFYAEN